LQLDIHQLTLIVILLLELVLWEKPILKLFITPTVIVILVAATAFYIYTFFKIFLYVYLACEDKGGKMEKHFCIIDNSQK